MKRILAAFTALGLATLGVAPLAHTQSGVGLKGGFSYGNVSNRGLLPGNLQERTGFALGVSFGTGRNMLGFGLEGLYAQRGVAGDSGPDERKLDYADVPVFLRVLFPSPGLAPYAYAGPQVSFELRCRAGASACPDSGRAKTNYAAVVGGGVRLGAQSAFTIEGRYIYGLTDLKLSTVSSSESYKTRSFLILGGVAF